MITLSGLGSQLAETPVTPQMQKEIDGFLLSSPHPTSADVAAFLKLYSGGARDSVAMSLVAHGVSPATITSATTFLNTSSGAGGLTKNSIWGMLALASAGACAYHGIKRNNGSIGWGAWWFLMGTIFPVVAPIIAVARKPGFAKPL